MRWKTYHAPNSGISAYAEGRDYIVIQFKTGERYRYDASHPGRNHVEEMKSRAHRASGLTTYINQHVRDNYAAKLTRGGKISPEGARNSHQPPRRRRASATRGADSGGRARS
jgi:hypothetical protein